MKPTFESALVSREFQVEDRRLLKVVNLLHKEQGSFEFSIFDDSPVFDDNNPREINVRLGADARLETEIFPAIALNLKDEKRESDYIIYPQYGVTPAFRPAPLTVTTYTERDDFMLVDAKRDTLLKIIFDAAEASCLSEGNRRTIKRAKELGLIAYRQAS